MDSQASSLVFFVCFLLFSSAASAFNITRLLGRFPDFTTFNNYLTQTKLNDLINSRTTITVLAVDNGAIAGLSGKSIDEIKDILSVHVVLDYFDMEKLKELPKKPSTLATLLQSRGVANGQQGFLSVAPVNEAEIVFGSAEKGAKPTSKLVKAVAAQPFNISVLQISAPIVPPGLDFKGSAPPKSSPAPKVAIPVAAPKNSAVKSPALAPSPSDVKGLTPSEAPTMAPESDAPVADAPTPAADAPAGSPVSDAPGAGADSPDLAPESTSSGSSRTGVASGFLVVMGLVSALIAF